MSVFLLYGGLSCLRVRRISLYHPDLFTCIDLNIIVKVMELCSCHVLWMHFCKILCLNPTFMALACSNSIQVRHKCRYIFHPQLVYLWKAGKLVHAIRYNNCIQILMILIKISRTSMYKILLNVYDLWIIFPWNLICILPIIHILLMYFPAELHVLLTAQEVDNTAKACALTISWTNSKY